MEFIKENKNSINKTFIELYDNYCEFDSLNKLVEKNEICLRNYKVINEKVAKVNNYSNNIFNVSSKKSSSLYNYQEFADDLKKLKDSVNSCQILAEKVLKNPDKNDKMLIKNIMIYFRFFQGNCNDHYTKKRNSIKKGKSLLNANNTMKNQEEKEDFLAKNSIEGNLNFKKTKINTIDENNNNNNNYADEDLTNERETF